MKKLLGIVVLGLLWCNVGIAETKKQKIINKYKSSLPECAGGEADIMKDLSRWTQWDKCFGILIMEIENEEQIMHAEFKNGEMRGKGFVETSEGIMYGKIKNGNWVSPAYLIKHNGQIIKLKINKKGEVVGGKVLAD